jgi:uncharacterized protein YjbI with pentapeptide repeats
LLAEMANQEHLDIVAQGVDAWNGWRNDNPTIQPDLSGANLRTANLRGINLKDAAVVGVDFTAARLTSANLRGARVTMGILIEADLRMAGLQRADMRHTRAVAADFSGADLKNADLSNADLSGAYLRGTRLNRALIAGARLRGTTFAEVDLREVIGLDSVRHDGPSTIGLDTIYRSYGKIPESFLRGAGVPENFITYMYSLTGAAFEFYSVFISYSTKDQEFADRLHADLQARGVRCWFAPHDIQGGRKIHEQIDEAIKVYDKLLLILSDASMNSNWVKTEIANSRAKEGQQERQMLFPITVVPFDHVKSWQLFDADTGIDSAREIRSYFIPDFSNWKDHDSYRKAFERLVPDLKTGPGARGGSVRR